MQNLQEKEILGSVRMKGKHSEAQHKRETWVQMVSCDFYKISNSTFYTEHLLATDFEMLKTRQTPPQKKLFYKNSTNLVHFQYYA